MSLTPNRPDTFTFWHNLNLEWVYTDLLRKIYAQTNNFHLANDLLHDAIVKFAVRNSVESILEPHAYLRSIVKHLIVDHHRYHARYVDVQALNFQEDINDDRFDMEASWLKSPERLADIKQRMHALQNIIDCLPAKCREVFWLYRIEGKSQIDIAQQLNISLNMVERHVMRALVDLSLAKDYLLSA
ncbi:RNA polymerase sigma factor, sigma-70 family [Methylophilaceae bacterium 11]|jgi:RNA polymerase sigma-70 factor (ECF subfamily)|uniref:RNA polymerase sigma factor n=1 Tax=Methylotenera sp. 1P/1 TaxID=1131551 RepID=UPI00035D051E|nr:sigma-70 family RNA polymerase sigma factor [Methylotenera sp. 1P/1]EUJ11253.1 RNA polymerase sigma factor, sigma-70 family [Methylophilaceae bacterium 11]